MLQTTKMNFETLLGKQVFKNHIEIFQSSLGLVIRTNFVFIVFLIPYFFKNGRYIQANPVRFHLRAY